MKIYGLWERLTELVFYRKGEVRIQPVDQDVSGTDTNKVVTIPNMAPVTQDVVLTAQQQALSNKTITASSYAGTHEGTYSGTFDRHQVEYTSVANTSGSTTLTVTEKKGVVLLTALTSGKLTEITATNTEGASFILVNKTGANILIEGETGNIKAGTDQRITLVNDGAVQFLYTSSVWRVVDGTVGQLVATHVEITTPAPHGFTDSDIGTPLYLNGSSYEKASAAAANTAEVLGIIGAVIDSDTFELVTSGIVMDIPLAQIEGASPAVGDVVFLSAITAGKMTTEEPGVVGQISKPLGIIFEKSTTAYKVFSYNMRGIVIGSANARNEVQLSTVSGGSVDIFDVTGMGGGTLDGWLTYTNTAGVTYSGLISFRFVASTLQASGFVTQFVWYINDTGWSSAYFNFSIVNNQIRVTTNSSAVISASVNFTVDGVAAGVTIPTSIDSERINFGEIKPRDTSGITIVNAADSATNVHISDAGLVNLADSLEVGGTATIDGRTIIGDPSIWDGLVSDKLRVVGKISAQKNDQFLSLSVDSSTVAKQEATCQSLEVSTGSIVGQISNIEIKPGGQPVASFLSDGKVGIGTSSPTTELDVLVPNGSQSRLKLRDSAGRYLEIGGSSLSSEAGLTTDSQRPIVFRNKAAQEESVRIDDVGQLIVYVPTPDSISKYAVLARSSGSVAFAGGIMVSQGSSLYGYQLVTTGGSTQNGSTLNFRSKRESDGSGDRYVGYAVGTGAWYQGNNSTAWSTTSDVRIKQNVRPVNNSLQKITELKPVHFEYVDKAGQIKTGFIAQEFEKVLPGHVHEVACPEELAAIKPELKDQKIKSIDADLIPYLVGAIQELKAELDEAKAKIAALEKQ